MKKNESKKKGAKTGGVPVVGGCKSSFSLSIEFTTVGLPPLDELPILADFHLSDAEFALWSYLHNEHGLLLLNTELFELLEFSKAAINEKVNTHRATGTGTPKQSNESESEGVTTVTEHYERFDEYGTAWENEVMKLPKAVLLSMLSDATKIRCAEMLDGNESKIYLMRVLKRQIIDTQSTKDKAEKGVFD